MASLATTLCCMSDGATTPRSDADLVAEVRQGDERAFAELYKAHFGAVRQVAASHLRDPDTVADVVQEAFTRALQNLPSLRDPAQFRSWLLAIARNVATDQLRLRQRVKVVDDDSMEALASTGLGPDVLAELCELAAQVEGCVSGLSQRDATALAMVAHLGFGPDQVGAALGLKPGAAKVVVHRARLRLRQALTLQLMVRQPSLACPQFRELLDSDAVAAGKHLESCEMCKAAAQTEVLAFQAPPMPAPLA
jgi:RNA polymerase sigma factor (sigma-70 family)